MKGIILAGGAGSRLDPMTRVASKQLQPVYDKPMVYYPLATLMLAGIRDIALISTPSDLHRFEHLLGTGQDLGISISYTAQEHPDGIPAAFILAEDFVGDDNVMLILGDNLFYGRTELEVHARDFEHGGLVFGYEVRDPRAYGVVEIAEDGSVVSVEEKPIQPKSNLAIPGLYLFDASVVEIAKSLRPSPRGELEITDVCRVYLERGELSAVRLGRGVAWLDSGTPESLLDAASFIATIEKRQGLKIACIEEVAYRRGFISLEEFDAVVGKMPKSSYREYLERVLIEAPRTYWRA